MPNIGPFKNLNNILLSSIKIDPKYAKFCFCTKYRKVFFKKTEGFFILPIFYRAITVIGEKIEKN